MGSTDYVSLLIIRVFSSSHACIDTLPTGEPWDWWLAENEAIEDPKQPL